MYLAVHNPAPVVYAGHCSDIVLDRATHCQCTQDVFDTNWCNDGMTLGNKNMTVSKTGGPDVAIVCGTRFLTRGKAQWNVRIDSGDNRNCIIGIGRMPVKEMMKTSRWWRNNDEILGYAWFLRAPGNVDLGNDHKFAVGDTITIKLDLDAGVVQFLHNDAPVSHNGPERVTGPVSLWVALDYQETVSIVAQSQKTERDGMFDWVCRINLHSRTRAYFSRPICVIGAFHHPNTHTQIRNDEGAAVAREGVSPYTFHCGRGRGAASCNPMQPCNSCRRLQSRAGTNMVRHA